jgi:hypothetical protein
VIVAVPVATPVTTPVVAPILAIPGEPELHRPPGVVQLSVVVAARHTSVVPVIGAGFGLTVTVPLPLDVQTPLLKDTL